ncbi:exonuclease [Gordonia phage Moosehead]|nr:exonuclease [Gordonia phage Moosehead]
MTLIVHDKIEQRSEEWFEQRRGIVTASVVGQLVTQRRLTGMDYECPKCEAAPGDQCWNVKRTDTIKTPHPERSAFAKTQPSSTVIEPASNTASHDLTMRLAGERINGWCEENTYMSDAMYRGVIEEPLARDKYSEHYAPVREVGFITEDKWGFTIGYSPDGLVGDDGLIEVKSRSPKNHIETVLADTIPAENMAQLQCGLLVTGREWIDYISYSGGMKMWPKRVYPDPEWHKAILAAVRKFEDNAYEIGRTYLDSTEHLPATSRTFYVFTPDVELEAS